TEWRTRAGDYRVVYEIDGKAKIVAPTRTGQEAAISGHLATLSFRHKKMIQWYEETRTYGFL
ncbi:MAG: type II toxin-antitoxin system RelE family toxin, partial [Bryobacteraceae bacterium]